MKTSKYRIVGLQPPGIFVDTKRGKINLDNADVKTLDLLYEDGCPYLEKANTKSADEVPPPKKK